MNRWVLLGAVMCLNTFADNPFVTHIYTADPTARVFDDVLYVYPSHDIQESPGLEGRNGFMMEDYHVFSSTDLMNFEDHGVILSQDDVDWVERGSYAMWAPDCIEKNGKYYFYFPGNFKIGVAIADQPAGPYTPHQEPIKNAGGIDPGLFIDDDGTPYIYFGGGGDDALKVMRLKDDMITPDMEPQRLADLGAQYKEGSFLFKRNGIYYFTYPIDVTGSEEIRYATGDSPLGPFTVRGTIIDGWSDGCWTDHHSVVEYNGQWYVFYHHHDISKDGTLRSICADRVSFNADGSINKVIPTRRGIGVRRAEEPIQVDRYLEGSSGLLTPVSEPGDYIGFYLSGIDDGNWINYPDVDFEKNGFVSVSARISAESTGEIEVHVGSPEGTLLGTIPVVDTGRAWQLITANLSAEGMDINGLQDLVLVFKGAGVDLFTVDWVQFNRPDTARFYFEGDGLGEVLVNGSQHLKVYQSGAILAPSETVTFSAEPKQGHLFKGWKLNGVSVAEITAVQEGDMVTAVFKPDFPVHSALVKLEAELYNEQNNIKQVAGDSATSSSAVGYIQNGSYIVFKNLDFKDGAAGVSAYVASGTAGGEVTVCLDRPDAAPVGRLSVGNTGDWNIWNTVDGEMGEVRGVHDVYIVFEGGSGFLMNMDWIKFYELRNGLAVLEAEDFSEQFGIQTESCSEGGKNIGFVEDGDYIVFEGVVFNAEATQFVARAASDNSGGTVTICLDDIDAAPVCSLSVSGTGGWQEWNSYTNPVAVPAGRHNVYVKFNGTGGYLFNLNWVKFSGESGYVAWLNKHNVFSKTNYLDDADGDGMNNLLEYGLDLDPAKTNRIGDVMRITPVEVSTSYVEKYDVDVTLYSSSNLIHWSVMEPGPASVDYPSDSVYYSLDIASNPSGFFKWNVETL